MTFDCVRERMRIHIQYHAVRKPMESKDAQEKRLHTLLLSMLKIYLMSHYNNHE